MLSLPMLLRFSLIPAITTSFLSCALPAAREEDDHTAFIFNKFNGSDLTLIDDASLDSRAVKLTKSVERVLGRAMYPIPVRTRRRGPTKDAQLMSFSTTFLFSIVPDGNVASGGHGMAFLMTPHQSPMGAISTQYLGLLNLTSNGRTDNHLFAVEFDTVMNTEFGDINDNHVGVDLNSLQSVQAKTAGYWADDKFQRLDLKARQILQAWIDYDHLQDELNVSITVAGLSEPVQPLISVRNICLAEILEGQMYVGFSAATGAFFEEHCVLGWSFSTEGRAADLDLSHLQSFSSDKPIYKTVGFTGGVTAGAILLFLLLIFSVVRWIRGAKDREFIEEWELEYWPHRFSYKELSAATKGFRDKELLGSGGFGRVYKGVIPGSGLQVGVKCIDNQMTEGLKEFVAEISSMGRMQHRNLVRLRGWCRKNRQLFIVYDYMANGSLDKMLFGNQSTVLSWPQRYKILKDVAAGLLYLHEQWEKRVVHRDVKSSNVLLDYELNARLGDFGLARLYDHTENPQTTHVVGTLGYIAPELIRTGRATPSSDVFSFGVLLLEVACGKRPVNVSKDSTEETLLIDWVWELYSKERSMDAVDPRLGGEYNAQEMDKVLRLGLLCSHPEPQRRLGMAHVLQILEDEGPLPAGLVHPSLVVRRVPVDSRAGTIHRTIAIA